MDTFDYYNIDIINYSKVKDKLDVRVFNSDLYNTCTITRKEFGDISIVYFVDHITVSPFLLKIWGIDEDKLHKDAIENTSKNKPIIFENVESILSPVFGNIYGTSGLVLITNKTYKYGASSLFYPGVLKRASDFFCGNFYAIPSSVHEFLLIKDDDQIEVNEINKIIREINETQVPKYEQLSDYVYYYDAKNDIFRKW